MSRFVRMRALWAGGQVVRSGYPNAAPGGASLPGIDGGALGLARSLLLLGQ